MTPDDYIKRSVGAQKHLKQVRDQIEQHAGTDDRRLASPLVQPLIQRQQEIIDELAALDEEFWGQ